MNRVDYIRLLAHRHRDGEHEYSEDEDFGILPMREIRRILAKYRSGNGRPRRDAPPTISRRAIMRAADFCHPGRIRQLANGDATGIGKVRMRRLSRVLVQIERGELVPQFDDKWEVNLVRVEHPPERSASPDHVFRIRFDDRGRAVIARGDVLPEVKTLPQWFAGFGLKPSRTG